MMLLVTMMMTPLWMRLMTHDEANANAYAEGSVLRSQAGAGSAVDDRGGGVDDPGGGNTDDLGSFGNLAASTTTSSRTSVSFVFSSLTTGISLLCSFLGQVSCGCGG